MLRHCSDSYRHQRENPQNDHPSNYFYRHATLCSYYQSQVRSITRSGAVGIGRIRRTEDRKSTATAVSVDHHR
jgi:hypothetical protein